MKVEKSLVKVEKSLVKVEKSLVKVEKSFVKVEKTLVKVENFHSYLKSYNKTAIDFNFRRHEDSSTIKSDIRLGLAASVNYHFFG